MTVVHRPGRLAGSVEVVTIGDELLLGATIDENGPWLCRRLAMAGFTVTRTVTVGDDERAIRDAIIEALGRAGTVICAGGLGATSDDRTRAAAAAAFGVGVERNREAEVLLRARLGDSPIDPALLVYADVPSGARVLPNPAGLAPGLVLEDASSAAASLLPGVPSELKALFDAEVEPWLRTRWPDGDDGLRHRTFRTTGLTESALARMIEPWRSVFEPPLDVAFLPYAGGVDLRLTYWGRGGAPDVAAAFQRADETLSRVLDGYLYGYDGDTLADALGRAALDVGITVAVAESCTGGLIGAGITARPGASSYFLGGVVAYADGAKSALLGVPPEILAAHGAVSEPVARAMAEGACAAFGADAAASVTGIAGPGGGTTSKPVGTVWIATAVAGDVRARRHQFRGDREEVRARGANAAMAWLWRRITGRESS